MADRREKAMEEVRSKEEEARRAEADRIAAEKEFLEQHQRQRVMSSQRRLSSGAIGGYHSGTSSQAESESEGDKRKRKKDSPEDKEKKRAKGKRTDEEDEDSDEDESETQEDPLRNLGRVLGKMRAWFKQPTIMKMVTKPQTEKFNRYLVSFEEELMKAREDRIRLETRIEERGALVDIVRRTVKEEIKKGAEEVVRREARGYADALAGSAPKKVPVPKVTGVKGPVLPAPKVVLVRHETQESEEVKTTLKRLVKPSEIGLKVRRLVNIRNGVIVEAENEEGIENLIKEKALADAGLKVERPSKKRPVIMVYDVSAKLKDEDVKEEVFMRNMRDCGIEEQEFNSEFEVKHRYKDVKSDGRKCHIVAECSVRVRNWLRRQEKIFVEWQCCRVKDYVDVARCYKCQRFGHIAKHCTAAKSCCSFCAGEHDYKECANKKKKEAVCCANCKREGRGDHKHDAGSRKCPAYEKAVKRQNERIDYGL